MSDRENGLTIDDLNASARRAVMVGVLWRGLVVNLLVVVAGALAGFSIGFLFSLVAAITGVVLGGAHKNLVVVLSTLGGFIVGLCGSWQYVRWLFRVDLAGYRLRLIRP